MDELNNHKESKKTTTDSSFGTTLVIKATPPDGEFQFLGYEVSIPSSEIVQN